MGAPISAYNRISDERCPVHSNIYEPDYVVVVDETLLTAVDVTAGLKKDGGIIINSPKAPGEFKFDGYEGKVYTIDASTIAEEELKNRSLSNTAMLGAVVKVSGVIPEDKLFQDMEESMKHKFANKLHVIEGNMKALKRSVQEVKGL